MVINPGYQYSVRADYGVEKLYTFSDYEVFPGVKWMVISRDNCFVFALQDVGHFKDAKYFDHCVEICICNTPGEYKAAQCYGRILGIVDVDVTAD